MLTLSYCSHLRLRSADGLLSHLPACLRWVNPSPSAPLAACGPPASSGWTGQRSNDPRHPSRFIAEMQLLTNQTQADSIGGDVAQQVGVRMGFRVVPVVEPHR